MAVVCGIMDSVLEHRYYPKGAPWLIGADRSDDNPSINGLVTFAFAFLTFQNVVPISLYISFEVVRTCQALFIFFDKDIMYEKNEQATLARTWNLVDDLGQIEYIFSDKTGTLTQNVMVFRHCSVNGKVYRGEDYSGGDELELNPALDSLRSDSISDEKVVVESADVRMSSTSASGSASSPEKEREKEKKDVGEKKGRASEREATSSAEDVPDPLSAGEPVPPKKVERLRFRNEELQQDIAEAVERQQSQQPPAYREPAAVHSRSNSDMSSYSSLATHDVEYHTPLHPIAGFFSVLALCHTVLASVDPETGHVEYKAQSPDEAALVRAAADAGFVFRGRDKEILRLETPFAFSSAPRSTMASPSPPSSSHHRPSTKRIEEYELLNLLDFTSARKRMSVIIRRRGGHGRILLLTKGADNIIFDRLKKGDAGNDGLKEITGKHLDEFAGEGLRTLTLAYKYVSGKSLPPLHMVHSPKRHT